jgi:hypothetical protein
MGGVHSERRLWRRRRGQRDGKSRETIEAVRALARICDDRLIAGLLNRNKLRTGAGNWWTCERVTFLRSQCAIPAHRRYIQEAEGWMNLTQAARSLAVSPKFLRLAAERGEIQAEHPLADGLPVGVGRHRNQAVQSSTHAAFVGCSPSSLMRGRLSSSSMPQMPTHSPSRT